jgi:23S rRNA pseudouridine1911/1915/1917 synthase
MLEVGQVFECEEESAGQRLDIFLANRLEGVSRNRIQQWLESGCLLLGEKPAKKNAVLETGDTIRVVKAPETAIQHLVAENLPLEIVYEDDDVVVVNKARGMVTHPGHGVPTGTLANALAYRYRDLPTTGGALRAGLVHRLDKDTTGLLVVARNEAAQLDLSMQLQDRSLGRTYRALVFRCMSASAGNYTWPLGRHERDPLRRSVRPDGKAAETRFQVRQRFAFATELELSLQTGRTHQIRVHLSHAGYPVWGDTLYGGGKPAIERVEPLYRGPAAAVLKCLPGQALHAWKIRFVHPKTLETLTFEAAPPADYLAALQTLQPFIVHENFDDLTPADAEFEDAISGDEVDFEDDDPTV